MGCCMLKFFRKYQVLMLAFGGSLLMVVFLLEPILRSVTPDPRKRVVGVIDGGAAVTAGELAEASLDLSVLERIERGFSAAVLTGPLELDEAERERHWFLLRREAERAGLIGSAGDGRAYLERLTAQVTLAELNRAQQQRPQSALTAQERQEVVDTVRGLMAEQVARAMPPGFPESRGFEALAAYNGVQRLTTMLQSSLIPSIPRTLARASEVGGSVYFDYAMVTAAAVEPGLGEPTDEELWAHVQRYGGATAGVGAGNELNIGYLRPARLKLEYLVLDPAGIRASIPVDPIEARKRWQRDNPSAPADRFAADRARVEAQIRAERATEIIEAADQAVRGPLLAYEAEVVGENGAVAPDWRSRLVDIEELAGRVVEVVRERTGVTIPTPEVVRRTDAWLEPGDIGALPGLSGAGFNVGGRVILPSDLAGHVVELGADAEGAFAARVGVPILRPFATTAGGARVFITVLEAKGASAPESLDEVRSAAVAGWRAERAMATLRESAGAYASLVGTAGLEALAELFNEVGSEGDSAAAAGVRRSIFRGALFDPQAGFRSLEDPSASVDFLVQLSAVEVREGLVPEAAARVDPLAPADTLGLDRAVVTVALPRWRALLVAVVRGYRPPTEEFMQSSATAVAGLVVNEELAALRESLGDDWPLAYPALRARTRFEPREDGDG